METIQLPPHSKEFLKILTSHNVEYLLVGGYAVAYHGYPRATIDIWINRSESNAKRVMKMLAEFGFDNTGMEERWLLEDSKVIRMGMPPNRIEILTSISGVEFSDCRSRGISTTIDGIPVDVIGLDDLKANKRASGRHKDLSDLDHLP